MLAVAQCRPAAAAHAGQACSSSGIAVASYRTRDRKSYCFSDILPTFAGKCVKMLVMVRALTAGGFRSVILHSVTCISYYEAPGISNSGFLKRRQCMDLRVRFLEEGDQLPSPADMMQT